MPNLQALMSGPMPKSPNATPTKAPGMAKSPKSVSPVAQAVLSRAKRPARTPRAASPALGLGPTGG